MTVSYLGVIVLTVAMMVGGPASAQTSEPWRAHVTAFTDKLYGHVDDTHNQRNYFWAKKLAAADHVALDDDVIFAAAMLHDVGSMEGWEVKDQEHGDTAAAKLDQMLTGTDFPLAKMERVREAMKRYELVYCVMQPGDALFFHSNLLHASARNDSDKPRWSMICCYNAKANNPYKEAHHPCYTPLKKVSDAMIKKVGARRFAEDQSNVAWLQVKKDQSARTLKKKVAA